MSAEPQAITASIVFHDLQKKVSYVTLTWDGQPEKKLSLPVPFGTQLDGIVAAAEKTLHDFAGDIAVTSVKMP